MHLGFHRMLLPAINIVRVSSAHLKAVCSLLGPAAKQNTDRQLLRILGDQQGAPHGPAYLPECEPP